MSTPDPFGDALAAQSAQNNSSADHFGDALNNRGAQTSDGAQANGSPPMAYAGSLFKLPKNAQGSKTGQSMLKGVQDPEYAEYAPQALADKYAGQLAESGHPLAATALHTLPTALTLGLAATALRGPGTEPGTHWAGKEQPATIEEGHPLTSTAQSEVEEMRQHSKAAEAAGVELPPRQLTPAQAYVNDSARRDLNLPKNAPVTDGLLDQAKKLNVSPAYEAAKSTPEFELGAKYQNAIKGIDVSKIDPAWQPPANGTMSGERAVELSGQLRSVARGMYEDADNFNLTYAQRSEATQAAQAHYQAAKAVEGGFREAAQARDALQGGDSFTSVADNWDKARTYNAKVEAWRGALDGAGNVSGPKIKKLLADEPVTGPMKEVGSVVAQYPELFRSTRLQTPPGEGLLKRGIRGAAPIAGAALGEAVIPGSSLAAGGGAALGESVANTVLGPRPRR